MPTTETEPPDPQPQNKHSDNNQYDVLKLG